MGEMRKVQKILIVEDEPDLAATCARLMSRMGYTPLVCLNGREAIELIEAEHPDLILSDLRLPAASGLAVLRRARRGPRKVPVIVITAYSSGPSKRQAMRAGAAAYLSKPFTAADLRAAVERALPSTAEPSQEDGALARDHREVRA